MSAFRMVFVEAGRVRGLDFIASSAAHATERAEAYAKQLNVYLLTVKGV